MDKRLPKLFVPQTNLITNNMMRHSTIGPRNTTKKPIPEDVNDKSFDDSLIEEAESSTHFIDMSIREKIDYIIDLPRYVNYEAVLNIGGEVLFAKLLEVNGNELFCIADGEKVTVDIEEINEIKLF